MPSTTRCTAPCRQAGGRIDAIFYCPHPIEADCNCRKPRTGMFERIAGCFNVDLAGYAVGRRFAARPAGRRGVGARPLLVLTGKGTQTQAEGGLPEGTQVFPDLAAAAEQILRS
jgi:D-glycero-D-manno-heptose 1,7-bisphosphate phosphatase